jgi:hypothetical protein
MIDREARELFSFAGTPVFEYERRRITWAIDAVSLTRFSKIVWSATALFIFIIWGLSAVINGNDTLFQDRLTLISLGSTLIMMIAVDFYSAFTIANGLHRQLNSEQWELIRTTGQREKNLFQAEFAIAQIRVWRPMTIEIAFRIAATENILLSALRYLIGTGSILGLLVSFPVLTILLLSGIGMTVYILEPLWRGKALAALSLAVAASVKNTSFAYLALFAVITIVHFLQIASLVLVWFFMVSPVKDGEEASIAIICCALPLGVIVSICGTYYLYRALRVLSLRIAFQRMFRPLE